MATSESTPFSARLDARLVERLKKWSAREGVSASQLAARFIEEGLRTDEFPGIVFRPGPTGRRAGLVDGPDVWEIVRDVRGARDAGVPDPLRHVADTAELTDVQVRLAVAYYTEYPDEVDARIATDDELVARLAAGTL